MDAARFRMTPTKAMHRAVGTPGKNILRPCNKAPAQALQDRFIPTRSAMDLDVAHYSLISGENDAPANSTEELLTPQKLEYKKRLAEGLHTDGSARILAFKNKAPEPPKGYENAMTALYSRNAAPRPVRKIARTLPQAPERILDAPDITDDYYLNLLDWSSTNTVAVALGVAVYLWNAGTGVIEELCATTEEDDYITSLAWAADGKHISVGTASATVQIWDASRCKQIRSLKGHAARVSALAWNKNTLSSGGRDSVIINHDVRERDHIKERLTGHQQEVCGLKWSPSGGQLASGGNDNLLHVWQPGQTQPVHSLAGHQAAVKALAWCPFQSNLLATGGGTADRCIKFWNTSTGAMLNSIDTGSQVCALQWSRHEREILSSHGFSQNQLCLWKYPSMAKIAEFSGHTARVLHMAQSPDGTTVVSAGADETLRFWKCFAEAPAVQKKVASSSSSALRSINIR